MLKIFFIFTKLIFASSGSFRKFSSLKRSYANPVILIINDAKYFRNKMMETWISEKILSLYNSNRDNHMILIIGCCCLKSDFFKLQNRAVV